MESNTIKSLIDCGKGTVLGRLGSLEVRLAKSQAEVAASQNLRYRVFFEDMDARPTAQVEQEMRDFDDFDDHCEHLLVIDNQQDANLGIVGTYRLLDGERAQAAGCYYSQSEFDVKTYFSQRPDLRPLELGRACIAKSHRSRRTMELAWHGVWSLVIKRQIDVMFGCASFPGTDLRTHLPALSLLAKQAALFGTDDIEPVGVETIDLISLPQFAHPNPRTFSKLPPLLKGYLRVGAKVASHAVIDPQFQTTDVLVVLNVNGISKKYVDHYGADASRFALQR